MPLSYLELILLFLVMAVSTRFVVDTFDRLVSGLSMKGRVAVAAILVALSTSLPELFVTLASVIEKKPEIALGTLLGSNVADLSIVIGGATLIGGALPTIGDYWRWELSAAFVAGIAPIFLMMDGQLSRLDGVILLTIYAIYLSDLVIDGRKKRLAKTGVSHAGIISRLRAGRYKRDGGLVLRLIVGIVTLIISGDLLVRVGADLALSWAVPVAVVGLLVISVGTTLPEFLLSIGAIAEKNVALVLGNLLGSIVTNATLIVGLLALLSPFEVRKMDNYALVNIAFVVIFGLFWLFTSSRKKLERWEGLVLVGLFFVFAGLVLLLPSL